MYKRERNKDDSSSKSKSHLFSARLHPDNPHEAEAIKIIGQYLNKYDIAPRQLLTDAILNMDGRIPTMFDNEDTAPVTLSGIREVMRDVLMAEFAQHLTGMIRDGSITMRDVERIQSDDTSDTSEFENNLISGMMARRKQKGKE